MNIKKFLILFDYFLNFDFFFAQPKFFFCLPLLFISKFAKDLYMQQTLTKYTHEFLFSTLCRADFLYWIFFLSALEFSIQYHLTVNFWWIVYIALNAVGRKLFFHFFNAFHFSDCRRVYVAIFVVFIPANSAFDFSSNNQRSGNSPFNNVSHLPILIA